MKPKRKSKSFFDEDEGMPKKGRKKRLKPVKKKKSHKKFFFDNIEDLETDEL